MRILEGAGCRQAAVLHCVSLYPPRWEDVNLRCVTTLAGALDVPVGISDHTPGFTVALAAVCLGAAIIEKHFTDDRGRQGPDHALSLTPDEFRAMAQNVRNLEAHAAHVALIVTESHLLLTQIGDACSVGGLALATRAGHRALLNLAWEHLGRRHGLLST